MTISAQRGDVEMKTKILLEHPDGTVDTFFFGTPAAEGPQADGSTLAYSQFSTDQASFNFASPILDISTGAGTGDTASATSPLEPIKTTITDGANPFTGLENPPSLGHFDPENRRRAQHLVRVASHSHGAPRLSCRPFTRTCSRRPTLQRQVVRRDPHRR